MKRKNIYKLLRSYIYTFIILASTLLSCSAQITDITITGSYDGTTRVSISDTLPQPTYLQSLFLLMLTKIPHKQGGLDLRNNYKRNDLRALQSIAQSFSEDWQEHLVRKYRVHMPQAT